MAEASQPSTVETIKSTSNGLWGNLPDELAAGGEVFEEPTVQLLKHHGVYQQEDRDRRRSGTGGPGKPGRSFAFLVRVKIPGGRITSQQFLTLLDLCEDAGNGTLRITDRQDIQLHGVLKRDLSRVIRQINAAQLTTLGACGDVVRNVTCCPAPLRADPIRPQLQQLACVLSERLLPRTPAYREIWLRDCHGPDEHRGGDGREGTVDEPVYGPSYLPRKFKIALALVDDNCVDVYTNDLGLVAVCEGNRVVGYNLLVGGGLGMTPSNRRTFPALAQPMAFVVPDQVLQAVTAVVEVYRDFGNRSDRKRARLKYLIADWGLSVFRARVEEFCGWRLAEPLEQPVRGSEDHLGWFEQADGRWFYGLKIDCGRIADREEFRLKQALREVCRAYGPGIRLTPHQNLLLTDLRPQDRPALESVLRQHGVPLSDEVSPMRRCSMACVALPTCPLAVTEAERVFKGLLEQMQSELERLGLAGERFTVRMTGCPNGCARPYGADVGLVGRTAGTYAMYLGGRIEGDRLGFLYKDYVPLDEIIPTLVAVLRRFEAERLPGESLGDYCSRMGASGLLG